MKPLDDLSAEDSEDLRVKLDQIDVSVPPRTQGRTSQHREAWIARHFLEMIADTDLLGYPIHIRHQDRPDLLLSSLDKTTGIEITVAEHVNHASAEALYEHMTRNNDKRVQDCIDVPPYRHDEKKHPREILESVTGFGGYPAMGRELEDNWIDAMVAIVEKKGGKFKSAEFEKHDRNWLLVYDNWSPSPSCLDDQDLECLAKQLYGSNTFDKIFILRDSGKRHSCILLEFSPNSTEYVEHPIYDETIDTEEQIEGLGEPDDLQTTDYPLDDIMVRSEIRAVGEVVKRIDRNRFLMDPHFQRDFVWDPARQSKLIESCIMRIPLPVLYVAEGVDGRIIVVDGLQRLTTFVRFIHDELKLTGLGKEHPLDGKRYSDLPVNLQERVEDTQLTLYILDKNAPQRAKLDIFDRVNSGSALTRQQMRNALYNGVGTQWLSRMTKRNEFLEATGKSLNSKTMRDREAVNRFAAFHVLGADAYHNGDMDEFLACAIVSLNDKDEVWLERLEKQFCLSMRNNYALFGKHAFRRSMVLGQENRKSVINISLFDVFSTLFSVMREKTVDNNAKEIADRVVELVNDEDYSYTVTYSTNSTNQVKSRFRLTMEALAEFQELEFLK